MASRWRNWDLHFATDVLENRLPLETMKIIPVGSRGRKKLNIPPNLLRLPAVGNSQKSLPVSGRGKSLQNINKRNENLCSQINLKTEESLREFAKRLSKNQRKCEKEWPSLTKAVESVKQNRTINDKENCKFYWKNVPMVGKSSSKYSNNQLFPSKKCKDSFRVNSPQSCQFEDCEVEDMGIEDIGLVNVDSKNDSSVSGSGLLSDSQNLLLNHLTLSEDYSSIEFLKTLEEPEKYVLVQDIPNEVNEDALYETVSTFGNVNVFLIQSVLESDKNIALVKMESSMQCDWVISCLDGTTELGDARIHVLRVEDLLEIETDE